MCDPSTLAIDTRALSFFQALETSHEQPCCLIVYSGDEIGRRIELREGVTLIGRAADAGILLAGPGISRHHAELSLSDGVARLRDLGSSNGTFVQQRRLGEAAEPLHDGDRLRLGSVVLKFYAGAAEEVMLHDRLYRLALVDAGTGAFNRRYLDALLARELPRAQCDGQALALICFDLDHFKSVNDRYGHPAGDQVLRETVDRTTAAVAGSGTLCRLGGEEFVVLLPGLALPAALALAERLRAVVSRQLFRLPSPDDADEALHRQTISLGVAALDERVRDATGLLAEADRQLYRAKRDGRNRVCG